MARLKPTQPDKAPVPSEREILRAWEVRIPGYRPTTVNELLRGVRARIRMEGAERVVLKRYCEESSVPRATRPRRVSLSITVPKRQRRWDRDGLWESLLDGLRFAGAIVNDSPDWVEQGDVEYVRGDRLETTIIIEDI